jgi:hypothetical protein
VLLCLSVNDLDPEIVRLKLGYHLLGVTYANQLIMEAQHIPALYQSGVRYRVDPTSAQQQRVLDCLEVLQDGAADCKSLACYQLASYRHAARSEAEALAYDLAITWQDFDHDPLDVGLVPLGGLCRVFHVTISKPDGSFEDPSARLKRALA